MAGGINNRLGDVAQGFEPSVNKDVSKSIESSLVDEKKSFVNELNALQSESESGDLKPSDVKRRSRGAQNTQKSNIITQRRTNDTDPATIDSSSIEKEAVKKRNSLRGERNQGSLKELLAKDAKRNTYQEPTPERIHELEQRKAIQKEKQEQVLKQNEAKALERELQDVHDAIQRMSQEEALAELAKRSMPYTTLKDFNAAYDQVVNPQKVTQQTTENLSKNLEERSDQKVKDIKKSSPKKKPAPQPPIINDETFADIAVDALLQDQFNFALSNDANILKKMPFANIDNEELQNTVNVEKPEQVVQNEHEIDVNKTQGTAMLSAGDDNVSNVEKKDTLNNLNGPEIQALYEYCIKNNIITKGSGDIPPQVSIVRGNQAEDLKPFDNIETLQEAVEFIGVKEENGKIDLEVKAKKSVTIDVDQLKEIKKIGEKEVDSHIVNIDGNRAKVIQHENGDVDYEILKGTMNLTITDYNGKTIKVAMKKGVVEIKNHDKDFNMDNPQMTKAMVGGKYLINIVKELTQNSQKELNRKKFDKTLPPKTLKESVSVVGNDLYDPDLGDDQPIQDDIDQSHARVMEWMQKNEFNTLDLAATDKQIVNANNKVKNNPLKQQLKTNEEQKVENENANEKNKSASVETESDKTTKVVSTAEKMQAKAQSTNVDQSNSTTKNAEQADSRVIEVANQRLRRGNNNAASITENKLRSSDAVARILQEKTGHVGQKTEQQFDLNQSLFTTKVNVPIKSCAVQVPKFSKDTYNKHRQAGSGISI